MPAAAHMFEGEIGYPPYTGSGAAYRSALLALIDRGHTFIAVEDGAVIFKADVGLRRARLRPAPRGLARAAPARAGALRAAHGSVVEQVMETRARWVTLYVNDFNESARATYARVGFEDVGTFSTVLL